MIKFKGGISTPKDDMKVETGAQVHAGAFGASSEQSSSIGLSGSTTHEARAAHVGSYARSDYTNNHIGADGVSSSKGSDVKFGNQTLFGQHQSASIDRHGMREHADVNIGGRKVGVGYNINFDQIGKALRGGAESGAKIAGQAASAVGSVGHDAVKQIGKVKISKEALKTIVDAGKVVAEVAGEVLKNIK